MPTVFTEGKRDTEGVLSEANGQRSRDNIVIASGAGIVAPMTVLGRITASGKYVVSENTASDGSETAVAVNLYGVDATSADASVAAIVRDAELNGNYLTYGASRNLDAEKLAARVDLAAEGVIVR